MNEYFKSIIDSDNTSIVICNTEHEIIYMNPAAVNNYEKRGGAALIGKSMLDCHNSDSRRKIVEVVKWFKKSADNNRIFTFCNEKQNKDVYIIALRSEGKTLIGYYERHEYRTRDNAAPYTYNN